eukprot:1067686-Amphidinium_carterae.1
MEAGCATISARLVHMSTMRLSMDFLNAMAALFRKEAEPTSSLQMRPCYGAVVADMITKLPLQENGFILHQAPD